MRKFGTTLYSLWAVTCFVLIYLSLFPLFFIFLQKTSWHKYCYRLNRIWSGVFFILMGVRVHTRREFKPEKGQRVVYCANHTSFLDIAAMMHTARHITVFMGKSSLTKPPVFGYMFKRLHIPVNRRSPRGRVQAMRDTHTALQNGKDVILFPEGGITSKNPPKMTPFKDGAFRIAIKEQIPIVPVTLLNNWKVLPDKLPMRMHWGEIGVIYHKPIETKGLTLDDLPELREKTYNIIDAELTAFEASPKKYLS